MMRLSDAAQVLHAQVDGADVHFSAVSTDTRTIQKGDLFIALKGENFDGAKFVTQANEPTHMEILLCLCSWGNHAGDKPS